VVQPWLATYQIVKDLLECGHWELADRYLTDRYIHHNPNAASGREGVVSFSSR
jgi:predicted SnoaL-like aldol condensation-catalyzing enzyme